MVRKNKRFLEDQAPGPLLLNGKTNGDYNYVDYFSSRNLSGSPGSPALILPEN